ncbi:winged helix DNA-binding protein [Sphingomonas prati]|uniref:DNA-binding MarR family transcriptional regulator n=1 Tax=Sphingomonas prati TaxID=1843237 RepID=A0A7W9BSZ4_9SPHN|nr:winged helix DNA-binding protein [Sphingomonas prati]MBB5729577.1 DNA-binding MarR family transcriptional regulator [Sphingomonas prati]GGE76379.1 hypothetical protein GCM10011404_06280 [Sphingomonas prati]
MEYGASTMRRTMVLVSDGAAAEARGTGMARNAELAVSRAMTVAEAVDAPDRALVADLLFVEVDDDPGVAYDALLARVARLALGGQAAVVAIRPELIDVTDAALGDAPVGLVCAGRASDRLAAIEIAMATGGGLLREDGPDREDQLRMISAELSRIADRLVASVEPRLGGADALPAVVQAADAPAIGAEAFRRILRRRRLRDQFLGEGLFSDPAWDMLLDLAAARLEGSPVAVSSLCIAAAVPATTALRWIRALTQRGLMVRTPDAEDGRRVYITLSDDTATAMDGYVRAAQTVEG